MRTCVCVCMQSSLRAPRQSFLISLAAIGTSRTRFTSTSNHYQSHSASVITLHGPLSNGETLFSYDSTWLQVSRTIGTQARPGRASLRLLSLLNRVHPGLMPSHELYGLAWRSLCRLYDGS